MRRRLRRICALPSRNGTAFGLKISSTCGGFAPVRDTFSWSSNSAKASAPTKHAVGCPNKLTSNTGPSSRARPASRVAGSVANLSVSPTSGNAKREGRRRSAADGVPSPWLGVMMRAFYRTDGDESPGMRGPTAHTLLHSFGGGFGRRSVDLPEDVAAELAHLVLELAAAHFARIVGGAEGSHGADVLGAHRGC